MSGIACNWLPTACKYYSRHPFLKLIPFLFVIQNTLSLPIYDKQIETPSVISHNTFSLMSYIRNMQCKLLGIIDSSSQRDVIAQPERRGERRYWRVQVATVYLASLAEKGATKLEWSGPHPQQAMPKIPPRLNVRQKVAISSLLYTLYSGSTTFCVGIFTQSTGAIGTEQKQGNRARQATQAGGIDSLESISGLFKSKNLILPYSYWARYTCRNGT